MLESKEMDLTKYQVFLKTVECGSFTAAAQQLSFTQSGVSHAISGLEEELGVTLLSRSRGGVTLTADGWALMPYIQEICRQQRSIEGQGSAGAGDRRGAGGGVHQRVGAVDALHPEKLSGAVSQH